MSHLEVQLEFLQAGLFLQDLGGNADELGGKGSRKIFWMHLQLQVPSLLDHTTPSSVGCLQGDKMHRSRFSGLLMSLRGILDLCTQCGLRQLLQFKLGRFMAGRWTARAASVRSAPSRASVTCLQHLPSCSKADHMLKILELHGTLNPRSTLWTAASWLPPP